MLLASYGTVSCVHMELHSADNIWKIYYFYLDVGIMNRRHETPHKITTGHQTPTERDHEINIIYIIILVAQLFICLFARMSHERSILTPLLNTSK